MTNTRGRPAAAARSTDGARAARLARALALAALALPGTASALSLGPVQGTAWIGRPLQLAVPVKLQPGEDPCVRAELAQGQEAPAALPWRLEPRPDGGSTLHLQSNSVVLEPVVTVRLTLGCAQQLSQSYVLLADLPPARENLPVAGLAESPRQAVEPSAPTPPATDARAAARPARTAAPARVRNPAPDAAVAASRSRNATQRTAPQPARRDPPAPASSAPAGRPRLQVDLLDFEIDQAPALKVSTALTQPAAGGPSREEARAAWQALNAPTTEQWAALHKQSEATLAELRELRQVTRRQSEQLAEVAMQRALLRDLVAGLAGALALGLAVLLWRRHRAPSRRAWWEGARAQPQPQEAQNSSFVDSSYPEPPLPVPPPPEDSAWSDFNRSQPQAARDPAPAAPAARASNFGDSVLGRTRLPSAEELLDVQEKADFFIAIGQPDQAIRMLEARLLELGGSPFLWLDLLDLCRRLGRIDDYERLRQQFQHAFEARLPSFTEAAPNEQGLERYPRALSRILLLWPSSRVLKEIEKALFEDPAPGSIMFDLEASRDLLLLYSVAQDVVSAQPDGRPYDKTALVGLEPPANDWRDSGTHTQPVPLVALDEPYETHKNLALDIDLDFSQLDFVLPSGPAVLAGPADADHEPAIGGAPRTPARAGATAQVGVDVSLDDLPSRPGPAPRPIAAATRGRAAGGAGHLAPDAEDATASGPALLPDLRLHGLAFQAVPRADPPAQEPPLPEVLDLDLGGGTPAPRA